jgi:peptide chain release factor subunit 1
MELTNQLKELAEFEQKELPVISLYLNTQADQTGRTNFDPFIRKELKKAVQSFPASTTKRQSIEADVERIQQYLETELQTSTNGLAIFACNGADGFFKALQLEAPIENNRLYIYQQPHLFPLARLSEQYQRYAALITDTNSARLYIFAIGRTINEETVENASLNRTRVGGWSQARYQRHVDNYYQQHAKEVVDMLEKVVREENIDRVVLSGDDVILPILREQMSQQLNEKIVDVLRLDIKTPEHEVAARTLEALREYDAKDDAERVSQLLDEYRSGGLAVAGASETLMALAMSQVDELFLTASLQEIEVEKEAVDRSLVAGASTGMLKEVVTDTTTEASGEDKTKLVIRVADELIARAQQTAAKVRFFENAALLEEFGGIAATLRYRLNEEQ